MSLFKKFIGKILGNQEAEEKPAILEYGDQLKNTDLDYKFAQLFTLSGGFFNYCADDAEALNTLNKIIKLEEIKSVFCCDHELQKFLEVTKTKYSSKLDVNNDAAFVTCEYLIAYDGRIMLSHDNILHYNAARLPKTIIVIANVSQIVTNLSVAMSHIKRKENIRNLTSISGDKSQLDNPNKHNTKLFLLLLED